MWIFLPGGGVAVHSSTWESELWCSSKTKAHLRPTAGIFIFSTFIVYFTSGLKMSPLFTSSFLIILRYTYSSSIAINRQSSTTGRGQDQSGYRTFGESFRIYIFKLVRFPQFWRFSSWSALNIDFWCQGWQDPQCVIYYHYYHHYHCHYYHCQGWRDPQRGAVRGWPLQPDLWRTRGKWKQR